MVKRTLKALWKDESAQGSTEYILLLAIVVAIGIMFRGKIMKAVTDKMGEVEGGMGQIKASGE